MSVTTLSTHLVTCTLISRLCNNVSAQKLCRTRSWFTRNGLKTERRLLKCSTLSTTMEVMAGPSRKKQSNTTRRTTKRKLPFPQKLQHSHLHIHYSTVISTHYNTVISTHYSTVISAQGIASRMHIQYITVISTQSSKQIIQYSPFSN